MRGATDSSPKDTRRASASARHDWLSDVRREINTSGRTDSVMACPLSGNGLVTPFRMPDLHLTPSGPILASAGGTLLLLFAPRVSREAPSEKVVKRHETELARRFGGGNHHWAERHQA